MGALLGYFYLSAWGYDLGISIEKEKKTFAGHSNI